MEASNNSLTNQSVNCTDPDLISSLRFHLVLLLGTPLAVFGVLSNLVLVTAFCRLKIDAMKSAMEQKQVSTVYLSGLAIIDVLIGICYLLLFTNDILGISFRIGWLFTAWHSYVKPVLTLSRMIQLHSVYLILFATLEKYILVRNIQRMKHLVSASARTRIVICIIFVGALLRLPTFWEFSILENPDCMDYEFSRLVFDYGLILSEFYNVIYNFYIMFTIQSLVPFLVLLILNILIVLELRKSLRGGGSFTRNEKDKIVMRDRSAAVLLENPAEQEDLARYLEKKIKLRSTLITFFAMSGIYLICNALDFSVKLVEHFASEFLHTETGLFFHNLTTDLISIAFMFNSSTRLLIYLLCNPELRREITGQFKAKPSHFYAPIQNHLHHRPSSSVPAFCLRPRNPTLNRLTVSEYTTGHLTVYSYSL